MVANENPKTLEISTIFAYLRFRSNLLEEALEEEGATISFVCLDLPPGDGGSSRVGFPPGGVAVVCDCMFIDGTTGLADAVDGGGSGESASELAK